jgi:hypothetical protein
MKTADQFLEEGAATFKARHAVYGDNYRLVGKVMTGMFPDGVTLKTEDDWNRMHILLLGIVKDTRYCQNWSRGGHADSLLDGAVYRCMLLASDQEINGEEKSIKT